MLDKHHNVDSKKSRTLGFRTTMGLPLPMDPLASSTLQVFAKASTKTAGSRAMTGEMVLKNDLTGIADEGLPAAILTHECCQSLTEGRKGGGGVWGVCLQAQAA